MRARSHRRPHARLDDRTTVPATVAAGASPEPGHGLSASLLSSAKRPEGTTQVTYNGLPLYTFKGDNSPGEAKGLDQRNGWYLISSSGAVGPPEK
jgi:Secreted repeat of unknown function